MKDIKVAVIGANGKLGSLVTNELIKRDIATTAIVRNKNQTNAKSTIIKDIFALTKDDLKEFDVIVDAFGVWLDKDLNQYLDSVKLLTNILANSNTRFIYLGGAGSLFVDNNNMMLYQTKDFPPQFYNLAQAHANVYLYLKDIKNVKWTFFSPAANLMYDAQAKNQYQLAGDILKLDSNNLSEISYQDYAKAIVDEIESGNNIYQRLQVLWP